MARPESSLSGVQRWMQGLVLDVEHPVGPEAVAGVILPSRTLTADQRVEIYRGMYPLRMREALESDYPTLLHFVGDERFDALVRGYLAVHPSRSYTLNRLGDHFPEHVAGASGLPRPAFCADLTRLEHAIAMVFDAPESPTLEPEDVAGLGERVAELRLRPIEAFRVLSFRYPANAYLQSLRDESHDHPRIAVRNNWLAVFRRNYAVRRLELTKEQHALLTALVSGDTLGEAALRTIAASRRRLAPDEFFQWFRDWVGLRLFRAL
jgi:hypothetical protein